MEGGRMHAGAPPDAGAAKAPDEDPMCRICFGGKDEEEEQGRLISPCKCKGSSRWIHVDCLQAWRRQSAKRASFFQCDQCHYRYAFRRATMGQVLCSKSLQAGVTAVLIALLVYVCGIVAKMHTYYEWGGSSSEPWWGSTGQTQFTIAVGPFVFSNSGLMQGFDTGGIVDTLGLSRPTSLVQCFVLDVTHIVLGAMTLGVLGVMTVVGLAITGLRALSGFAARAGGRQARGSVLGSLPILVLVAILLAGFGKVCMSIWDLVYVYVSRYMEHIGQAVLEVPQDVGHDDS